MVIVHFNTYNIQNIFDLYVKLKDFILQIFLKISDILLVIRCSDTEQIL